MKTYLIETLGTAIRLNFMNFDEKSRSYELIHEKKGTNPDLEISFYRDIAWSIEKKFGNTSLIGNVKRGLGGSYRELVDIPGKKIFCFFEEGIDLDYILRQEVNRSLLVFQHYLDIIFLHAASITIADKVDLFIAPSGGGKSTISSLAREKGFEVMGEETCAVKRKQDDFYAGAFPCFMPSILGYKEKKVGKIFFLNKSNKNTIKRISVAEAVKRALPEAVCFFNNEVPREEKTNYRAKAFDFLNSMFEKLDFGLLDFANKPEVFSCLTQSV